VIVKTRHLLTVIAFCFVLAASAQAQCTALDAVQILPAAYREGVLKISADNGVPNPQRWYFIARKTGVQRAESLTVQGQEIVGEKRSLDLRTIIENPSPIDFSRVKINSNAAWDIAMKYASDKGRKLASVSYVLQQKGASSAPLWSVWCYDPAGGSIGLVTLMATSGEIVSSE